ncbi:hypothetical protein OKW46_005284 [Paraburkholderia sp. WSM4179]|nr:hypothetical protein [Paraburkholderia sp. WSM4179]
MRGRSCITARPPGINRDAKGALASLDDKLPTMLTELPLYGFLPFKPKLGRRERQPQKGKRIKTSRKPARYGLPGEVRGTK